MKLVHARGWRGGRPIVVATRPPELNTGSDSFSGGLVWPVPAGLSAPTPTLATRAGCSEGPSVPSG
eukprot:708695-Alexandrium_andersonii.AAC.1